MRILHLIDHLGLGGAQTALATLLEAWPDGSDQLSVVGLGRQTELEPRLRQAAQGGAVQVLGGRRWSWAAVRRAAAIVRQGDFDIVHAHLCKSVCTALWVQPGLRSRLVVQLHAALTNDYLPVRWALRRWQPRVDALVGVSRQTVDAARRELGLPSSKLQTIYCPLRACRPAAAPAEQARPPGCGFVVGFAGRLAPEKGLTYLLQVLQQLGREPMAPGAILVGDGPLRAALERETADRGLRERVVFTRYQAEPDAWIRACDVMVFPSLTEGLPLAVVESMALGRPVVASHVGGVAEVIRHGETGLLCAPRDVEDLGRAITTLAASPQLRRQLTENASRDVVPRFEAPAIAGRWRDLYRSLVTQP